MQFLDRAKIYIKAGNGGHGALSFRREKFIPRGGPDGGNGGKGSDIIIRAESNLNTLIDFRYQQHYKGGTGAPGASSNRSGRSASPLILRVPIGTQIFSENEETLLYDFLKEEEIVFLRGGRGGIGNAAFKSSINQTPFQTIPPEEGDEMWIWLILKLIADVGLVGLPNAGKSTFLSMISNAKPKIANYPFTTLNPQLGMVYNESINFVVADLPGLIEGASKGHGLGHRFLKHVERCKILLHLVDSSEEKIVHHYHMIRKELSEFRYTLSQKKEIVLLTKSDLSDSTIKKKVSLLQRETTSPILQVTQKNKKSIIPVLNLIESTLFK